MLEFIIIARQFYKSKNKADPIMANKKNNYHIDLQYAFEPKQISKQRFSKLKQLSINENDDQLIHCQKKIPLKYINMMKNRYKPQKIKTQPSIFPQLPKKQSLQLKSTNKINKTFKVTKNTVLLNEMINILKNPQEQKKPITRMLSYKQKILLQSKFHFNEFIQLETTTSKTTKNARPKLIENELTRIISCNSRKLQSQQKNRIKIKEKTKINEFKNTQLITFYNRKLRQQETTQNKKDNEDQLNQFILQ